MGPLLVQLFGIFAPIVRQIMADHKASTGADPTDAEVLTAFSTNIDKYLAEGANWTAAHPKP